MLDAVLVLGGQSAKGSTSLSPSFDSSPDLVSMFIENGALKSDDVLILGGHSMSTGTHEPEF
jgi:hypothetical protein